MAEEFEEFFTDNTQWVGDDGAPAGGAPPRPPKSRREMRRRRRHNRHKHIIALIAVIVTLAVIGAGVFFGYRALKRWAGAASNGTSAIEDYPGPGSGEVQFTVETGQGAAQIAEALVSAEIVKSQAAFTSVVSANGTVLYPGTYTLKKHMKAADVVTILSDQSKAGGFLEVRSGERLSDVIAQAISLSDFTQADFDAIIDAGGSGILPEEAAGSFEGWLEPGTYDIKGAQSASALLKQMVDARIAKLDAMGVPSGAERERVMIIASIAEAEVNSSEYYGKVTRVIENRLADDWFLGMDTTVAYGLGVSASTLTNEQLQDDTNPYNTRVHKGLPPTPISNPGDNAIAAALSPESGDWTYFVTVNLTTGETKFTSSDEEFAQYVAELREWEAANPDY